MGKGGRTKNKSKRSTIPRGIPQKRSQNSKTNSSPFEYARSTNSSSRVKHLVHNKQVSGAAYGKNVASGGTMKHQSALAKSIERRKNMLQTQLKNQHKSNEFIDRRIGEAGRGKVEFEEDDDRKRRENAMLKRIVAERVRRSKRAGKFSLDDDDDGGGGLGLTHRVSLYVWFDLIHDTLTSSVQVCCMHFSLNLLANTLTSTITT